MAPATSPDLPDFPGLVLTYPGRSIAQISLSSPPANALSLTLWRSLTSALQHVESDASTTVLILSSGLSRPVFSAGNDINELHAPSTSPERFHEFWTVSTAFLASLYETPLYTIAAMRGACPAGGCILGLCCDMRIGLKDSSFRIGLNEAALGIPVPSYWAQLMLRVGSARGEIERMLLTGRMADAKEALRLGIVDRLVGSSRELTKTAEKEAASAARRLVGPGGVGYRLTKRAVRHEFAAAWAGYAEEEAVESWKLLSSDAVSRQLGKVLSMLNGRKASAKL